MWIPVRYNLRHLAARWRTTCVTGVTFALVVGTFVIVMSLARGVERALEATGDPLNVIVLRPGVQAENQSMVSIEVFQTVRAFPGIAKDKSGEPMAAPEVLTLVTKPRVTDGKAGNIQIRGVHAQGIKMRPVVHITEGRMFKPGLREIVVARRLGNRFSGLALGDRPRLGRGQWTIVGIFEAEGTAFDSEVWSDYQELMQEFDRTEYNTVVARAVDETAVGSLKSRVDEDRRVKLVAKTEAEYYAEQTLTARPIRAFAVFLAVMMSIGASFAGMNTMYANVARRVREIGTLRVLGFTPLAVLASFMIESIVLAFCGGLAGCLIAFPMNGIATATTNFETFSEIVFYFSITPGLIADGLLFAVVMGAVGGFLPAWSASRRPVLSAIRDL